jgi:hypothetical protein
MPKESETCCFFRHFYTLLHAFMQIAARLYAISYCDRDRSFQYPLQGIFQEAGDMRLQHPGLRLK